MNVISKYGMLLLPYIILYGCGSGSSDTDSSSSTAFDLPYNISLTKNGVYDLPPEVESDTTTKQAVRALSDSNKKVQALKDAIINMKLKAALSHLRYRIAEKHYINEVPVDDGQVHRLVSEYEGKSANIAYQISSLSNLLSGRLYRSVALGDNIVNMAHLDWEYDSNRLFLDAFVQFQSQFAEYANEPVYSAVKIIATSDSAPRLFVVTYGNYANSSSTHVRFALFKDNSFISVDSGFVRLGEGGREFQTISISKTNLETFVSQSWYKNSDPNNLDKLQADWSPQLECRTENRTYIDIACVLDYGMDNATYDTLGTSD